MLTNTCAVEDHEKSNHSAGKATKPVGLLPRPSKTMSLTTHTLTFTLVHRVCVASCIHTNYRPYLSCQPATRQSLEFRLFMVFDSTFFFRMHPSSGGLFLVKFNSLSISCLCCEARLYMLRDKIGTDVDTGTVPPTSCLLFL